MYMYIYIYIYIMRLKQNNQQLAGGLDPQRHGEGQHPLQQPPGRGSRGEISAITKTSLDLVKQTWFLRGSWGVMICCHLFVC